MKKSTINPTERLRRGGPSPEVQEIEPTFSMTLLVMLKSRGYAWGDEEAGGEAGRSTRKQLVTYTFATLDPLGLPDVEVQFTFRAKNFRSWEAMAKYVVGSAATREIMSQLAERLRDMVESKPRQGSTYPIEIALDAKAGTATLVGPEGNDLLPLAEEAMDKLMALVTADESREPGVRQQTYEAVRGFLRQLTRVVPLPTDYAKAWKAKYPPTKEGPNGEPVRQKNMGKPDIPYREEPLSRAFEAIVQHAATWPTLPAEDVLDYCRKEVQEALLEDIGVKLPDWAKNSSLGKKSCSYLKSISRKCDDSRVQEVKPTNHTQDATNGLDAESFPKKLRTVFQRYSPEERKQRMLAEIEAFASDYPDDIENLIAEVVRLAELKRPPKTERTLNLRMASERSGLSVAYLSHLCIEGSLGEQIAKKPRFSEVELDEFVSQVRKPGPKPKSGGS